MIGIGFQVNDAKPQKDVFGPELVTNGGFADSSSWSVTGPSTVNTGVGRVYAPAGEFSLFNQNGIFTIGQQYKVSFDVISTNGVNVGSNAGGIVYNTSTTGYKSFIITAVETGLFFKRISGVTDVSIDNVSVKKVL